MVNIKILVLLSSYIVITFACNANIREVQRKYPQSKLKEPTC